MAIVLDEPSAPDCRAVLIAEPHLLISAVTVAECLIVASRRGRAEDMRALIDGLGFEVVAVSPAQGRRVAAAYERWGKGIHPADIHPLGLNFGDCFAYALAQERRCGLLYVGSDFARTDVIPALAPA